MQDSGPALVVRYQPIRTPQERALFQAALHVLYRWAVEIALANRSVSTAGRPVVSTETER